MIDIKKSIFKIVSASINGSVSPDELKEETTIAELGINSMTLISILFEMETELDFEIADMMDEIDPPETLKDLIGFVTLIKETA